jgi:pimeloyl-ACP methyl ester carboxylesterase
MGGIKMQSYNNGKRFYIKEFVNIGGIRQYITARGENTGNPLVLFLHGGPGAANIQLIDWYYHSKLAQHFTLVQWDQRGAGKSYFKDLDPKIVNTERLVEDCRELVQYLLNKFHQTKLFLVGESWGAVLGTLAINKYPEFFHSFTAVSPGIDPEGCQIVRYENSLKKAREQNNLKIVNELMNMKKPPYDLSDADDYKNYWKLQNCVVKLGGFSKRPPKWYLMLFSMADFILMQKTMKFALQYLAEDLKKLNLFDYTHSVIPYYIFVGEFDLVTPPEIAEKYFQQLECSQKDIIHFADSAHTLSIDEADKYVEQLGTVFNKSL